MPDVAPSRDSFRALYEDNVGAVHGFLRARVGSQEAEDLTAETFCRAFEHLDQWEDRGVPIRAWLVRIAYNLVVGRARRSESRATHVPLDDEPYPTADLGPEEQVSGQLEVEAALAAMASLSESHRTVIQLRHLQGLSAQETGEVLGIGEEAVRALSYRALRALRAAHVARWSEP